jgi:hypothetical protein
MLMSADDRRIDENPTDITEFRGLREEFEQSEEATRIDPATKPLVDGQPAAELGGEISPGDAGPGEVEQRLEEKPLRQFRLLTAPVARHLSHVTTENGPRLIGKLVSHGILPRKRCETYRLSRVKTLTGPRNVAGRKSESDSVATPLWLHQFV